MPIDGAVGCAAFSTDSRTAMGCVAGEVEGVADGGSAVAIDRVEDGAETAAVEVVFEDELAGRPKRQRLCTRETVPMK